MSFLQCFIKSSKLVLLFIVFKIVMNIIFDSQKVKLFILNISNWSEWLVIIIILLAIWFVLTMIVAVIYYLYKNYKK